MKEVWFSVCLMVLVCGCAESPSDSVSETLSTADTDFEDAADGQEPSLEDAASEEDAPQPQEDIDSSEMPDGLAESDGSDTWVEPDATLEDGSLESEDSAEESDTAQGDSIAFDAGTGSDDSEEVEGPVEPLKLNHLQAIGTHNSYHKKPDLADLVPPWNYEHLPLNEQLGEQGVRQFELDVYFNEEAGDFEVYHFPVIDEEVTCGWLSECVQVMKGWSDENPTHHPFLVLVEVKSDFESETAATLLSVLDEVLLSVWPVERLVTPDVVQGDFDNVRDAIAEVGWPTIDSLRGRGLFVLHAGGEFNDAYTDGGTTTEGRILFPDSYGNLDNTYAAVHSMNDPQGGFDSIQSVVAAGHMVRTRSDSDSEQFLANDYSKYEAALASGAHFISTDYPGEPYGEVYAVNIPGGTPSACNPISAPSYCTSEAIEVGVSSP